MTLREQVFNQELRALGNGLATAVNWSANLVVSSTFLHLSHGGLQTAATAQRLGRDVSAELTMPTIQLPRQRARSGYMPSSPAWHGCSRISTCQVRHTESKLRSAEGLRSSSRAETKGLSLDEVRALFERKVGIDRGPDPVSDRQPTGGDSGYYVVGDEDSSEPEDEAEEGGDPDRAISEPELAPPPNAPTKRASDPT